MPAPAEILTFPQSAHGPAGRPQRVDIGAFTPFVSQDEADRVRQEGSPSDDLQIFLRSSLDKLQAKTEVPPPYPAPSAAPLPPQHDLAHQTRFASGQAHGGHVGDTRHDLHGGYPAIDPYGRDVRHSHHVGEVFPGHPAYEAPRPVPIDIGPAPDYAVHQFAAGFQQGQFTTPQPAPRVAPAQQMRAASPASAPAEEGGPFEVPSFLQRRPGVPQALPPQPRHVALEASQRMPPRPATAGLRAIAGDIAWVYSVFPAIMAVQIVAGHLWEPLVALAASVVFLVYAALWWSVRPALFHLRVSAGWQLLATVATFRALDGGSSDQLVHVFAAFAATVAVLVAMGGIEIYQRVRSR